MKIIIVNSINTVCGVHQLGCYIYDFLKQFNLADVEHCLVGNANELYEIIQKKYFDAVIFNWHSSTMYWLKPAHLYYLNAKGIRTAIIPHNENCHIADNLFDVIIHDNPFLEKFEPPHFGYTRFPFEKAKNQNIIPNSFGFAGFLFPHKNLRGLFEAINEEYPADGYVVPTVRIHSVPYPGHEHYIKQIEDLSGEYSNIVVEHSAEMMTANELVEWMSANALNVFPYSTEHVYETEGTSTITDFAIAARRPFLVGEVPVFRHIWREESKAIFGKNSLRDTIDNGFKPFEKFATRWNEDAFVQSWSRILEFMRTCKK